MALFRRGATGGFPRAQGFGADTTGGRGGSVYVVTNLNDSGAGSFRDAVSEPNRIVVFAVGGYIDLDSSVSVSSNITILGQTAPGQGIGIEGYEVSCSDKSNIIIQYMRFREGSTDPDTSNASLNLGDLNGGMIDHVSAEFSQYDNIDAVGANSAADNITYQNDLIADPIKSQQLNLHEEGNQTTYLDNIFANGHGRTPLAKSNDQYVNNVVYDYGYGYTTGNSSGTFKYDIINNYFIAGPSTTSPGDAWYQLDSNQSAYSSGNLLDSNKNGVLDGSATSPGGVTVLTSEWSAATQYLPTLSATGAYSFDVGHAGDSLSRDPVDAQIISQVQSLGTSGSIMNEQDDDGLSNNGFGTISGGTAPTDTDGDGIPDAWETTHGLNPNVADSTKLNPLGYTMIEEYAQQLGDEYASQTWSNASGDWTTGVWSAATPGIYDHALIRGNGTTNGSATISGSDVAQAFSVSIGGNGPAAGESLSISGGSLAVQDTIYVGDQNNGAFTISGGTVRTANVQIGNTVFNSSGVGTNYTGTLNISAGMLQTNQIVLGAGSPSNWTSGGSINWSGGTIQAIGILSINTPINLTGATATLDSNTFNGTVSGLISGGGALTKISAGTITFTAQDSYSGGTTINGGAIRLAGSGAAGTSTIVVNVGDGIVLGSGVTLSAPIQEDVPATEFVNVDASASATLASAVSTGGSGNQYRLGVTNTGASLTVTGVNTSSDAFTFITQGTIAFSGSGGLIDTNTSNPITIGRATAALTLTVGGSAVISQTNIPSGSTAIATATSGNGANPDVIVTLQNSATINAGVGNYDIADSSATNATTPISTFNLNGGTWDVGGIVKGAVAASQNALIDFNGGTLTATQNNSSFLPALSGLTADVLSGGAKINDGGFAITIAQPLLTGASTDGGLTKSGLGTTTLAAVNTYNGPTTVTAGTLAIASGASIADTTITVNPSAGLQISGTVPTTAHLTSNGATTFAANTATGFLPRTLAAITIGSAGDVALSAPSAAANRSVLITGSLSFTAGTGLLDLDANDMIVHAGGLSQLTSEIAGGYNGGSWNGAGGITSTAAAGSGNTALGIEVNSNGSSSLMSVFDAQSVTSTDVLVKYTYFGDANLDGIVNGSDYTLIDNGFNNALTGWRNGDFNYDGVVNGDDYTLIDNAFNTQGASLAGIPDEMIAQDTAQIADAAGSSVPEPSQWLSLTGVFAVLLLRPGKSTHIMRIRCNFH